MFLHPVLFPPLIQNPTHVSVVPFLKSFTSARFHFVFKEGCSIHVIKLADGYHCDELDDDVEEVLLTGEENQKIDLYSNSN